MQEPCYTCRRRRIRCDQSQSPCAKCTASGLECSVSRPLRWVNGVAMRGKMRGTSFETPSDDSTQPVGAQQDSGWPKDSPRALIQSAPIPVGQVDTHNVLMCRPRSVPSALGDFAASNLDTASRYYLDYYNDRICKLFIVYDSEKNPFRTLISLALLDQTLLNSILALAARHRVNKDRSFYDLILTPSSEGTTAHYDALRFKYQAIQGISHALNDATMCQKNTTVASTFLLVFLDLLESGSDRWNFHLEGAKRLIETSQSSESWNGFQNNPGQSIQELRTFLTSQIYSIETLGGTLVRPKLLSQFGLLYEDPQTRETVEQSVLGCPEYLLDAIRYLTVQRDAMTASESNDETTAQYSIENTKGVIHFIHQFDCSVWATSLPHVDPTSVRDVGSLCILARTYQLAALIYGQRVLGALTNEFIQLENMAQQLLEVVDKLKDDKALYKCILWPIFIACMECREQEQRGFHMSYLERFWADTSCVNVINAAKIVEGYWQQNNDPTLSQWIFNIGHLGQDWLLI
ncbi:hypothetical protein BO71DRAFT_176748 [Aspergillus ellipticus CBS 707.79]|uniref:Zn(2)-C6 fungal-type domain-containing protein n=1 Tax=Aspergillus ellipticus CBS 707.79 TaxID=1448320 RepID=A0A319DQV1_9EURO|nr:hypothetical protein BO71DRAFT_176748 [Aspergillus ellipticus CBS 707.79]